MYNAETYLSLQICGESDLKWCPFQALHSPPGDPGDTSQSASRLEQVRKKLQPAVATLPADGSRLEDGNTTVISPYVTR